MTQTALSEVEAIDRWAGEGFAERIKHSSGRSRRGPLGATLDEPLRGCLCPVPMMFSAEESLEVSTPSISIAAEIRAELRNILRQRDDLRKPLDWFGLVESRPEGQPRYYVLLCPFGEHAKLDDDGCSRVVGPRRCRRACRVATPACRSAARRPSPTSDSSPVPRRASGSVPADVGEQGRCLSSCAQRRCSPCTLHRGGGSALGRRTRLSRVASFRFNGTVQRAQALPKMP